MANQLAGLGRLQRDDPGDRKYLLPPLAAPERHYRHWPYLHKPLDQGGTSECVVYSGDALLKSLPIVNRGFANDNERTRVYKEVQALDEWPGDDYDGTSIRAFMKWLKAQGLISKYSWAFDLEPALNHLLHFGPLHMGTDWTFDMFMPDRHGYVHPGGSVAGGHGYVWNGVNLQTINPDGTQGCGWFLQSYGLNWGNRGRFKMRLADIGVLIRANGEAATPTELRKAA